MYIKLYQAIFIPMFLNTQKTSKLIKLYLYLCVYTCKQQYFLVKATCLNIHNT